MSDERASLSLDPSEIAGGMYHLLNAAIAPRPIAWVASRSTSGIFNLAPHSYTTVLSPNPPIVGFVSIGRKDTQRNIEATGDFVYHIASADLAERLNRTAADFPADESEFTWSGLTPIASDLVSAPRMREAPISFEARSLGVVRIADTDNSLIMGQIVRVHLDPGIMVAGRIAPERLQPLGRLAGSQFSRLGELFSLDRPTYRGLIESGAMPMPGVDEAET